MTLFEALKFAKEQTQSDFVAREILKFSQNLSDERLILNFQSKIDDFDKFKNLIYRFKNGTPLEYILQKAEFLNLEFYVDERALIPRFETEILVKKAINIASNLKNPKICEIGTGSGIISVCLKKELKNADILAIDISDDALEVAKINAKKHNVDINFLQTSLLDGVSQNFDLIVSNPPYIAKSYALDNYVLSEPKIALFGGEKGDEILEKIINLAKTKTRFLACEMGYDQKQSLSAILENTGFEAIFYKDLAGFDRGFCARNLNL